MRRTTNSGNLQPVRIPQAWKDAITVSFYSEKEKPQTTSSFLFLTECMSRMSGSFKLRLLKTMHGTEHSMFIRDAFKAAPLSRQARGSTLYCALGKGLESTRPLFYSLGIHYRRHLQGPIFLHRGSQANKLRI